MILTVLLVSILTVAPTMAVAQDDALSVLLNHRAARARGDLDAALALWADDGVIDGGGGCTISPCIGKAAIRKSIERKAKAQASFTVTATYPSGSVVTQRGEVRHNRTRKAGIDRVIRWRIYVIRGGKIVSQSVFVDRTDPQTVRYIKWRREQRRTR
jgi:ketosteroid isomerase-like protein